jgi:hypothetical protein
MSCHRLSFLSRVQHELLLATKLPGTLPLNAKEPSPLECCFARDATAPGFLELPLGSNSLVGDRPVDPD